MDVAKKTLKIIEEKKIKPVPRWQFLLKDYCFWFFSICSIIIGSMAASALFFMLFSNDWDVYKYLGINLFEHIFICMPYLWAAILFLFVFLAYYNLTYTRRGYKYEIRIVILWIFSASVFIGAILFFCGLGFSVHNIFMKKMPFYGSLVYEKEELWNNSEKGLLGGEIIRKSGEREFLLKDFNGKIWLVKEDSGCCNENLIRANQEVELMGVIEEDNIFIVKILRPWVHTIEFK
jgi:hypothetical protein